MEKLPLKKNQEINLTIGGLTNEGSGVGRYEGTVVFVAGTAPGDEIIAHIILVKKNYAVGIISKIIKPAPCRIESDCGAFPSCGGCAFRHIDYEAEKEYKTQMVRDSFSHIAKTEITPEEIITACPEKYRNKAQYPVRIQNGKLTIGFFSERSHRVIDCTDCRLQPDEFSEILKTIRRFLLNNPVSVYDEANGKGLVRHIYLRKAFATGQIMVCIVINGDKLPRAQTLCDELLAKHAGIESIVLNINKKNTNVILGEKCVNLYGNGFIEDILCGNVIRISPLSFYQVNRDGAELLYKKAAEYADLTGEETLLDLYCGAGTIGLSMADKVKSLIGVEIVPEAVEDAKKNAERNGIKNAEFICADASEAAKNLAGRGIRPDVIIVDPPRKGCGEELVGTIAEMSPCRIVYVSCDHATLARDCIRFAALGYTVQKVTPVDMFPRTTHVETVVLMSRDKE